MSIDFFVLSFLKKASHSAKLVEKKSPQNENSQRKRKNEKRGRKSTNRESFTFSKQTQKERKTHVYSYKREYNTTCALSNALFRRRRRRRRERSERGFFILVKRNKEVLLAYARLGVLCSRERERETFAFVVEKSSPISEAAASSSSSNLLSITSSSARTFKKRREK